ncbi:MAG: hypothetical protein HY908_24310 [Myxococcales bacterium]|nr:hypothetical protein [Myxococcales bacterium]
MSSVLRLGVRVTGLVACLGAVAACSGDESSEGAGGSGGSGGAAPTGDLVGDVLRYDYGFDLATGQATSRLTVGVVTGGDCFVVPSDLEPASASFGGAPAVVTRDAPTGALRLCGAPVAGGAELVIDTAELVPEGTFLGLDVGFSRQPDLAGGTFSYLLSWVGGCDHFGPCDDAPGRLAAFGFDVTHAPGTTVLCPGVRTAESGATHCELDGVLAPTYSAFALAADPAWVAAPFTTGAGVAVSFYEAPGGELASSLSPADVAAFLGWITSVLGPFPYGSELRVAGGPTSWLGFEHPSNIVLYESLPSLTGPYADPTRHVLMHEIIHQWAGDRTTLASAADFVWKEATAEYLAYVYEDEHGPAGEADATRAYWDAASQQSAHYPRPTDDPLPAVEDFYGDVYGPGPMVLYQQLEALVGRPAVLAGIADFLAEPGARSVEELRAALEAASGADLGPYFAAWVFGSGAPVWPSFVIGTSEVGGDVTVTLTQAGPVVFPCAVEVDVSGLAQTATAVVDFGTAPSSPSASVTVTLGEPLVTSTVDPRHRVIGAGSAFAKAAPIPVWRH